MARSIEEPAGIEAAHAAMYCQRQIAREMRSAIASRPRPVPPRCRRCPVRHPDRQKKETVLAPRDTLIVTGGVDVTRHISRRSRSAAARSIREQGHRADRPAGRWRDAAGLKPGSLRSRDRAGAESPAAASTGSPTVGPEEACGLSCARRRDACLATIPEWS